MADGGKRSPGAVHVPSTLAGLGALAFAIGVLVYLTDRDPGRAALIPAVGVLSGTALFGAVGAWLPSFTHAFAFSLFTAAVGHPNASVPAYGACAMWWALNSAFELAQLPQISHAIVDALKSAPVPAWLIAPLSNSLMHGTFDVADLVAVAGGALAAAAALHSLQRKDCEHE
ncbi:MAG: hypothetical protein OEW98_06945 [Betaproteobacteria bacterium]|nr:hypothetical protein [Betaproteobacteria bacterium]